jgi:hypothetical protein
MFMAQDFTFTLQPVSGLIDPLSPGTILASATIVTSQACGSARIKQAVGRSVPFKITDSSNPKSPISVVAGGEYNFNAGGAGYGTNVAIGSVSIADSMDYPEGLPFQFQILQR